MSVYIEKVIESDTGHENSYWEAIGGKFNLLLEQGPDSPRPARNPNKGVINFAGWKDLESKNTGKKAEDTKRVEIDLSQLQSFPTFFSELAQLIISDDGCELYQGTIKDTDTEE